MEPSTHPPLTITRDGREFKYQLQFVAGSWKPLRLAGTVPPGEQLFETYDKARTEARRRNKARAFATFPGS